MGQRGRYQGDLHRGRDACASRAPDEGLDGRFPEGKGEGFVQEEGKHPGRHVPLSLSNCTGQYIFFLFCLLLSIFFPPFVVLFAFLLFSSLPTTSHSAFLQSLTLGQAVFFIMGRTPIRKTSLPFSSE